MKIELELHDARKELPTESKIYLVNTGWICTIPYSAKHKLFNAYDGFSDKEAKKNCNSYPRLVGRDTGRNAVISSKRYAT